MRSGVLIICAVIAGLALAGYAYCFPVPLLTQAFPDLYAGRDGASKIPPAEAEATPLRSSAPCERCAGKGRYYCIEPKCDHGSIPCPGKCLKLSEGYWEKMDIPGQPTGKRWKKLYFSGGWAVASEDLKGHIVVLRDGAAVDEGICPDCKGATTISCPACRGSGYALCSSCDGTGKAPFVSPVP